MAGVESYLVDHERVASLLKACLPLYVHEKNLGFLLTGKNEARHHLFDVHVCKSPQNPWFASDDGRYDEHDDDHGALLRPCSRAVYGCPSTFFRYPSSYPWILEAYLLISALLSAFQGTRDACAPWERGPWIL